VLAGDHGSGFIPLSSKIALSLIWALLEYIRSNLLFSGFPWGLLGAALHKETILIQTADIGGVYGITFSVVFINLCLSSLFLFSKKEKARITEKLLYLYIHISLLLFLFSFLIIYGETRMAGLTRKRTVDLRAGLIQPNVESELKWDFQEKSRIIERYKNMSLHLQNVDLTIWPESVLPGELFYDSRLLSTLMDIIEERKVPVLLGSGNMSFDTVMENGSLKTREIYYNSVYLLGSGGKIEGIYNKMILVPFGEYIPLREFFPGARHLTPITESFQPGRYLPLFIVTKDGVNLPFGTVICIEDAYPELIRKFVAQGARFMVNVTNDGWYSGTPCAYQHFAHSVFRAVENRVPLVRCANTGVSAIISADGDTAQVLEQNGALTDIAGLLQGSIPVDMHLRPTLYTRCGDSLFVGLAVLYLLAYLAKDKIDRFLRALKRRYL
jgi:apolipoprotein N-acyltransferase